MKMSILSINASDSSGSSGIQSDVRTASDFGIDVYSAITSITTQNISGIKQVHNIPEDLLLEQIRTAFEGDAPQAVKIGMINDSHAIRLVRNELMRCGNVICSPGVLASSGGCIMSNESLHALTHHILPITRLLIIKCVDAEILLGRRIMSENDMRAAVGMLHDLGAEWVLLRGGSFVDGSVSAILSGEGNESHFSSLNIKGWRQHGVGSAFSTAITCRIALGDDVPSAIRNAHTYLHNKVIYTEEEQGSRRLLELYEKFTSLLAGNHSRAHDVAFYASELAISTRYLAQITNSIVGKSPKQVIDDYLLQHSEQYLIGSDWNIQEISRHLGFSSQITFSSFFSKKKGMSPTDFRKKHS